MKTFKDWLSEKGITLDSYNKKDDSEKASLFQDYVSGMLKEANKNVFSKEQIEQLIKDNKSEFELTDEAIKETQAYKDLEQLVDEATKKANAAAQNSEVTVIGSSKRLKAVASELKQNSEKLKSIAKRQSTDEVQIKALTLRSSVAGEPFALEIPGIDDLQRKARTFYDFLAKQVIPLPANHSGVLKYRDWDEATTVKAAAAVAEGAAFPESTARFTRLTVTVEKVGDTLPVTEEFFEDEAQFAGEVNQFLSMNVSDKVANDVVLADGSSPNIHSIDSRSLAYTAAASGITDANIFDLCTKVKEAIDGPGKFDTDFAVMNLEDYNKLVLKKDSQNRYVFDQTFINSLPFTILVDNHVAANSMYMGDSRFITLYEVPGVALSQGVVNNQFNEDEMTLKARKRLAFLIKNMNQKGFRKVASISAALTTLAT